MLTAAAWAGGCGHRRSVGMTTEKGTVTVIGLGLMGSALARAFSTAGYQLTVWNRTPEKTVPFQGIAAIADAVHEACAASDAIVVSVLSYAVSNALLRTPDVERVVADKTLIQLTTGTPAEARDGEDWARRHDVAYLDGAITTYPRAIGRENTTIFFAGQADVFEEHRELLSVLGKPTFLDEAIGVAATLDLALLESAYAQSAALLHAAALCAAESVPLDVFFTHAAAPKWLLELTTRHAFDESAPIDAASAARAMERPRTYPESVDATMITHTAAVGLILQASREAGIDTAFPQSLHDCYERDVARGHGRHDLPALYEAFLPEE
jgi:3-hydroxyisobutyrate dehydrogenase-like beta-hydroxyacid dehydrogenase